MKETTCTLF